MLGRILTNSRYLIIIAVLGSFLTSIVVLVYAGVKACTFAWDVLFHGVFGALGYKQLAIESIELIDLLFLGTVLYIIALSLYELFINDNFPIPSWLIINDIDDLKSKLIGIVVVLLAVTFLGNVVNWDGSISIVALGAAIGLVLLGLGYTNLSIKTSPLKTPSPKEKHDEDKAE